MANEIVPGMNTQARVPAGQGEAALPVQPAPVQQKPSSIREYLDRVRAAGTVPTFTNVGGAYPNGAPGGGEVFQVGPGGIDRHGYSVGPATPPEQINPADQPVMGGDPYQMAETRLKHMLPDMWQQMFGDKPRDSGLAPQEQQQWNGFVTHMHNLLVKKYDKKIGQGARLIKDFTGESVDRYLKSGRFADLVQRIDWVTAQEKAGKEYDRLKDHMNAAVQDMSREEYIAKSMEQLQRTIDSFAQSQPTNGGTRPNPAKSGQNGTKAPGSSKKSAPKKQQPVVAPQEDLRAVTLKRAQAQYNKFRDAGDSEPVAREKVIQAFPLVANELSRG